MRPPEILVLVFPFPEAYRNDYMKSIEVMHRLLRNDTVQQILDYCGGSLEFHMDRVNDTDTDYGAVYFFSVGADSSREMIDVQIESATRDICDALNLALQGDA